MRIEIYIYNISVSSIEVAFNERSLLVTIEIQRDRTGSNKNFVSFVFIFMDIYY